jgi:hypothetical protein
LEGDGDRLNAICLFVAGALHATLPTREIVVAWEHSVEKSRWEEHYRIDGANLQLVAARVRSFGAGMEPPPDASLREGWWTWAPPRTSLPELRLTLSSFVRDYDICFAGRCEPLKSLVEWRGQSAEVVAVRACASP